MSRVKVALSLSNLSTWEDASRFVSKAVDDIVGEINGGINLKDNCQTKIVTVVFTGASVNTLITHGLGFIPNGYILSGSSVDLRVFDGTGTTTVQQIYLKASGAGTARILFY